SAGGLSGSTGNTGGAAVYVNYSTDNPAGLGLENDVEADHNLTKATDDDTADELTSDKGWTE
ncbi:MAG: hypothetical protein LBP80_12350, partial [Treponema sp.]|nr:hypothetical protein [Treponema sp.]